MQVDIVTLFPEMFTALTESGISSRAIRERRLDLFMHNPRDYALDKHQTVDDRPYGGGPGMVMSVEPLRQSIDAARRRAAASGVTGGIAGNTAGSAKVIYLSPQGAPLEQGKVLSLSREKQLVLLCGRYEGIDERLIESQVDEELSIGDFVISGGELAAMVLLDAIIRHLPGALGDEESAQQDSFMRSGLLDCPHYTRPEVVDCGDARNGSIQASSMKVPQVLLSGDHEAIRRWRLQQSLLRTRQRRPDLFRQIELNDEERALLEEAIK